MDNIQVGFIICKTLQFFTWAWLIIHLIIGVDNIYVGWLVLLFHSVLYNLEARFRMALKAVKNEG